METISKGSIGGAVEDIQTRLARIGFIGEGEIDGVYGETTAAAVADFCRTAGLPASTVVDDKVWAALVDSTFELGDRTLYLRMPYFHGNDVAELQQALDALGFPCGGEDGIFGAHTEDALRKFQFNMALPTDGIAGAYTFDALRHLHHSWVGKVGLRETQRSGFARAADVLERNAVCLYGTDDFTRSVASRISNIAIATNPASKIVSADALLVEPDSEMLLVQVAPTDCADDDMPVVIYGDESELPAQLAHAIAQARSGNSPRMRVVLPGYSWMQAGLERTAQHYAITLLDAICAVL